MKPIRYLLGLVAGCMLFSACSDDLGYSTEVEVQEGIPVTATLSYANGTAKVVTKADAEDYVGDLYLLQFNAAGQHEGDFYFSADAGTLNTSNQTIEFKTTTGKKHFFAVANVVSKNFISDDPNKDLKSLLEAEDWKKTTGTDLDNWLQYTAAMAGQNVEWAPTDLLMSGRFDKNEDTKLNYTKDCYGLCTVNLGGNITTVNLEAGKIWLQRVVASVTFNISWGGKTTDFKPTSYSIYNLPQRAYLFDDKIENDGPFFSQADGIFFTGKEEGEKITTNSFQFYMLENQQAQLDATDATRATHAFNTSFSGTYVIIRGQYWGAGSNPFQGNDSQDAYADVTYRIPLGYVEGVSPAKDFSVFRNYKYVYNVTINGVDDIIVEAYEENKETYGPDGHVVFTEGEPIEVDAHYTNRILLEIKPGQELVYGEGVGEKKLYCSVKTPMTGREVSVMIQEGGQWVKNPDADIDWVYFVEKSIADAWWASGLGPNFEDKKAGNTTADRVAEIMTIYELAQKLEDTTSDYYTNGVDLYAYVDEYLYDSNKADYAEYINYQAGTVNQKMRSMKIALQSSSEAQLSTVSSAKYTINQRPIITYYDMNKGNNAWGIESINENLPDWYYTTTDLYEKSWKSGIPYGSHPTISGGYSQTDGYKNMVNSINTWGRGKGASAWKSLETENLAGEKSTTNAQVWAACMSRNRDENGDGRITDNEIRWYLPAINQYQHFWIGTDAIPDDATLYPAVFREATVNQANPEKGAPMFTLLASGGHRMQADESYGLFMNTPTRHNQNHIRCARNIHGSTYDPIVTVSDATPPAGGNGKQRIKITVDVLTNSSLREQQAAGMLAAHNEHEPANRLSTAFEVMSNNDDLVRLSTTERFINETKKINIDRVNPCAIYNTGTENGWRPPNQRELILMFTSASSKLTNDKLLYSQTFSSLWNYKLWVVHEQRIEPSSSGTVSGAYIPTSYRDGYVYVGGGSNNLELTGEQAPDGYKGAYVRCVRDL